MVPRPTPLHIQLRWELVLLIAVLAVTGFAARDVPLFEDGRLLWSISYLGLLASALAFSFRLGTPNLAITGAALLSMMAYGVLAIDHRVPQAVAALAAVLVAGMFGAALALAADLLPAPAWAVTFAGMVVPIFFVAGVVPGTPAATAGAGAAVAWFLAFVVISIGGGAWFALPAVRRRLMPPSDEGPETESDTEAMAAPGPEPLESWVRLQIGLAGSCLIAGLAGVVAVLFTGDLFPRPEFGTFPMFNFVDLFVVLGAVLLGGVSIRGDQGGVAGTAIAVTLLAVVLAWLGLARADGQVIWLVVGAALLAGFTLRRALAAIVLPTEDAGLVAETVATEDTGGGDMERSDQA